MSGLSAQQQGVIGQYEFAKLLILGSGGQLEVDEPISDDERRDIETHRKRRFRSSLAFQVKTSRVLSRTARRLVDVRFNVPRSRVFSDPGYWYFFAHLDLERMGFSDPVFLVPSRQVHEHARFGKPAAMLHFSFSASLAAHARDKWVPYRVTRREVGKRVLEILVNLKADGRLLRAPRELKTLPDLLWVKTRR
jgi:hypothetical protein